MIEIERTGTEKNVQPEYYEAAAAIAQPRHFPSPVNDTKWIKSATEWFVGSRTAMEVGPGRGEFAVMWTVILCSRFQIVLLTGLP
jgi:hypothetical protein